MTAPVEPLLFCVDPDVLDRIDPASAPDGVPGALVADREHRTEAEIDVGVDPLEQVAAAVGRGLAPVICRIDPLGPGTCDQLDAVLATGVDEVLLPRWDEPGEVERTLELLDGRAALSVMIESMGSVASSAALEGLPIQRAYVGLLDLALDRGSRSPFEALVDGTVEQALAPLRTVPYGVAGLTVPGTGEPIPDRLLMGEVVRLGCSFSFLRRSFLGAVAGGSISDAIRDVRRSLAGLADRTAAEVAADRTELERRVRAVTAASR